MTLSWLAKVTILLLLATKLLVGEGAISLNNSFLPEPFINNKIDLNSPDEVLRMIRIIELYPLLKRRVDELSSEKQEIIALSLVEKNALLTDYEEQNNYLKNRGKFWYYVAVIGIPVVGVVALGGGIYLGVTLGGK